MRLGAIAPRLAGLALLAALPALAAGDAAAGIVVWDFDNQTAPGASTLGSGQLDYLQRALSESVTAALLEAPGFVVVERQRLKDVLAEQKLGASDLADPDTRIRLGRIAGAGRMVFGGFFALGDMVQVNLRVIDAATSRVLFSDEMASPADAVMQQVQAVNRRLVRTLGGAGGAGREYPRALWQAYDAALALSDAGRYDQAVEALQRLLAKNNDFTPAERQLVALLDKMKRR